MRFAQHVGLAALVFSTMSARADAQLPTVQQVFDTFATAVGGRDAWSKVPAGTSGTLVYPTKCG